MSTPDWLKAEIFEDFLKTNHENFTKITNFAVEPALNAGENYTTILLRVNIDIQLKDGTTQSLTFMAKVLPAANESQKRIKNWKFFDKELNTYKKYIPAFEDLYKKAGKIVRFAPKVLNIESEDMAEQLIMEDLQAKGFRNVKRQDGLDMQHSKCTLEKLAQFHAASACYYEMHGPYPELYEYSIHSHAEDAVDELKEYRVSMCKFLCETLPIINADITHLEKNLKYYCDEVPDQYGAKSVVDASKFNVLNHGDCWVNNIMFRYESDASAQISDTYFVDYQLSRYGSPAYDLYYFLLSSTCLENKIKYFDYFIYFYHQKLVENLLLLNYAKDLPSLRDLHVSLFENGDWAFTISSALLPIVLVDPAADASIENVLRDSENADNFKRRMFTNERYVRDMSQILPWMEHRGLLEYKKK